MSDIIWTKHAKERNKERKITENWVEQTINSPDKTKFQDDGKTEYRKRFGDQIVTVVATKSREGRYLILSTWINPPAFGTSDYKKDNYNKEMKKAGVIKKFWLTFVSQLGL